MKEPSKLSTHKPKHLEILNAKRKAFFVDWGFTRELNFYLAGGTGLAFYLNHRISVDFDFYRFAEFPKGFLMRQFHDQLAERNVEVLRDIDNTFDLVIESTHLRFFHYPYRLLRKLNLLKTVNIASVEDIAAMKLVAIAQRGNFRDFVDAYYLIKKFGLKRNLGWIKEKYPGYSEMIVLKGLLFFASAEEELVKEKTRIRIFDEQLTWSQIQEFLRKEVVGYQKAYLG